LKLDLTINALQKAYAKKETTCLEVVLAFEKEIKSQQHLNAFLEYFEKSAKERANYLDNKLANGEKLGKLFGVVIGIKDILCYKDHICSVASKMLENFTAPYSATAIQKLIDEDAIIIGRLNCDEFAMGSTNENSAFGTVLNAADNTRVAGGSSGGSAVAVQANLCHVALGSDTGGSVRMPASYCGVYGMKPSYGTISRYGLVAYASSFDQIGVFAKNIEDLAITLEVISGSDDKDSTMHPQKTYTYKIEPTSEKKKIAVLKETLENEGLDLEVKDKFLNTIHQLEKDGHHIEYVDFPYLKQMIATYYVLTSAEASSNLARYDGIHYGYRSENANTIDETYTKSRSEALGKAVKRRILLGTFILCSGYKDQYYTKAMKVRNLIKITTEEILDKVDFILSPVTTSEAFKIGEKTNPIEMYLADIFTVQANLAGGLPALALPFYKKDDTGMPFGLQIVAKKFDETHVLNFGNYLKNEYFTGAQ